MLSGSGRDGIVSESEETGEDVWSVSQVLSFAENGRVQDGGVWNSKNALTGFEKLV